MLQPFRNLVENPRDVPLIPRDVSEYLQARLNPGYLIQAKTVAMLHAQGFSESYIAGFLAGCQYAIQAIDDVDTVRAEDDEDGIR